MKKVPFLNDITNILKYELKLILSNHTQSITVSKVEFNSFSGDTYFYYVFIKTPLNLYCLPFKVDNGIVYYKWLPENTWVAFDTSIFEWMYTHELNLKEAV